MEAKKGRTSVETSQLGFHEETPGLEFQHHKISIQLSASPVVSGCSAWSCKEQVGGCCGMFTPTEWTGETPSLFDSSGTSRSQYLCLYWNILKRCLALRYPALRLWTSWLLSSQTGRLQTWARTCTWCQWFSLASVRLRRSEKTWSNIVFGSNIV